MGKTSEAEEVQVLRFFESGPIDKVDAVYNIITEKMRQRRGRSGDGDPSAASTARRQPRRKMTDTGTEPQTPGEQ